MNCLIAVVDNANVGPARGCEVIGIAVRLRTVEGDDEVASPALVH